MLYRLTRIIGAVAVLLALTSGSIAAMSSPAEGCWYCVDQQNGGMVCIEVQCDGGG
jgi:hypothetical protein